MVHHELKTRRYLYHLAKESGEALAKVLAPDLQRLTLEYFDLWSDWHSLSGDLLEWNPLDDYLDRWKPDIN